MSKIANCQSLSRARKTTKKIESEDDLLGFDKLEEEDQQILREYIGGNETDLLLVTVQGKSKASAKSSKSKKSKEPEAPKTRRSARQAAKESKVSYEEEEEEEEEAEQSEEEEEKPKKGNFFICYVVVNLCQ
jgi:uncharacterized membrane protein YdbT with pleckstrin-like domain